MGGTSAVVVRIVLPLALALGGCGSPEPSDTPAPPQTPEPAVEAASPQTPEPLEGTPVSAQDEALGPGTYVTADFRPAFQFTVTEQGVWEGVFQSEDVVVLVGNLGDLVVASPEAVYDPQGAEQIDPPGDFVEWLAGHPSLEAAEPTPATVGGVSGTQLDVEVTSTPEEHQGLGCPVECLLIAPTGAQEPFWLDETHRLIVLEVGDEDVLISLRTGSPEGEAAQEALVETIRFSD